MNKIGFKNFRRFQSFPLLEYSGITFLVGRNNTGKSTLVKALLLLDNYFKSGDIKSFSFGNNVLEDANVVTFGRAKNYQTEEKLIAFSLMIKNYYCQVTISGEDDDTFAKVQAFYVGDADNNFNFNFSPQIQSVSITKIVDEIKAEEIDEVLLDFDKEIKELKNVISQTKLKKSSKEYIVLLDNLNNLVKKRNQTAHHIYGNDDVNIVAESDEQFDVEPLSETIPCYSVTTNYPEGISFKEIVSFIIEQSIDLHGVEYIKSQRGEETAKEFEDYQGIKQDKSEIEISFNKFYELLNRNTLIYLGANAIKQSALFAIRDQNNALAQAIHEYKQLDILEGEEEHRFVLKWMRQFEVGDDFNISMHAGEAYEMKILSNNAKIHLADKGMGSIQAMLLIMRIAVVIKHINNEKRKATTGIPHKGILSVKQTDRLTDKTTVIIEEPELNLHPALQSKLADLFLDVHQKYSIDFLIETHSEYILRRSQVIVAENELEVYPNENPFCVHYFPKDIQQIPYKLEYQEDGSFNRNFGDGFFDEASSSTLELLKLKRQKKV